MIDFRHSSDTADRDEPDNADTSNDPRDRANESYNDAATTTIDSAENIPGDQPEDHSPPLRGAATGTMEPADA